SRYFNRQVALIASALYVMAPFRYIIWYEPNFGGHSDSVLFSLAALFCFYEVFFNSALRDEYFGRINSKKGKYKLFLLISGLGLISGFETYVCYTFLATTFIIFLFWFFFDPLFFRKRYFYIYTFAFLIGFSPWLIYNFENNFIGFILPRYNSGEDVPLLQLFFKKGGTWPITLSFLKIILIRVFSLEHFYRFSGVFVPKDIFFNIMRVVFISTPLTLVVFFIKKVLRKSVEKSSVRNLQKELIIFIFVSLILILYCLFPVIRPGTHYLTPAYPFIIILIGIFISKLWHLRISFMRFRGVAMLLLTIIFLSGFYYYNETWNQKNLEEIEDTFHIKGYSLCFFPWCFRSECYDYLTFDLKIVSLFFVGDMYEREDVILRDQFFKILGNSNGEERHNWHSIIKNYDLIHSVRPGAQPYAMMGAGITVGDGLSKKTIQTVASQISPLVSKPHLYWLYEGVAVSYCNRMYKDILNDFKQGYIEKYIPHDFIHYFYTSLGRRIAEGNKNDILKGLKVLHSFPSKYHTYLYNGFKTMLDEGHVDLLLEKNEPSSNYLMKNLWFRKGELIGNVIYNQGMNPTRWSNVIKSIPDERVSSYMLGVVNGLFTYTAGENHYGMYTPPWIIAEKVKEVLTRSGVPEEFHSFIYEGIGFCISLRTHGLLNTYNGEESFDVIPSKHINDFYIGYGFGLSERYDGDNIFISELVSDNIPVDFQDTVIQGVHSWLSYMIANDTNKKGM
ncbi:MAG: hypothetical protein DRP84_02080, partial [Spirochaetes bacterium]